MKSIPKLKRKIRELKKYVFKLEEHIKVLVKGVQLLKEKVVELQLENKELKDGTKTEETVHNSEQSASEAGREQPD